MSVFGSIMSAIFGQPAAAQAAPAAAPSSAPASAAAASPGAPPVAVDVEDILTKLAARSKEKLDWRKSIVDLMKLLDLDSSLAARKELAQELKYSGDTNDSASMNIWLHKQVMTKLAENGGKVPSELKH
jgi:3-oxoacyl-ACP reductase-like protein